MKCIKKGAVAKKVTDAKATRLVGLGWSYCSKTEWRNSMKAKDGSAPFDKEPDNAAV